jgi:hypothetical protein
MIPVSLGELLDKITILNLKKKYCRDAADLQFIDDELGQLLKVSAAQKLTPTIIDKCSNLGSINERIWCLENDIRHDHEDPYLKVEIAFQIRDLNDQRSTLKREINEISCSQLTEVKVYD